MSSEYTQHASSNSGLEDLRDPARSADGQTARQVANVSEEPSIDRAREAFERTDLDRERSVDGGRMHQSGSTGASRRQRFSGRGGRGGNTGLMLLCGIGLGAALMYILDPSQGRRRRALLRDKLVGATNKAGDVIGKTSRDLRNRAQGVIHEAGSMLTGGADTAHDQGNDSEEETAINTRSQTAGQRS